MGLKMEWLTSEGVHDWNRRITFLKQVIDALIETGFSFTGFNH